MSASPFPNFVSHGHTQKEQVEFVDAQLLPTVEADVITGDADIVSIVIANESGAAAPKFTIKDKQAVARVFAFGANTPVAPGASVSFDSHGTRATGGLRWVQDTASALVGRIEFRRIRKS